ncbi:MAG: DnaJ domain-containing protein [Kiritimatiellae bacterium]|nr:DnaJ domain-containing protein [Kiritimatiellia bacterium]
MGENDYYKILEVHPEASNEVVKKAYQTLAQRYHPDRHDSARRKWAEEHFKELSEAYQVLSDPVKRREYDKDTDSEEPAEELNGARARGRGDEEAYFSYRIGLEHYQNAQKNAVWRILLGKIESDLQKARAKFVSVLEEYPNSKYAENANYYYLCCLMECFEYTEEYLKDTEEEFTEFLDEYPRSSWQGEVMLRFAKFYLLKKRDYSKARKLATEIIKLYEKTELAQEAKSLLEYTQAFAEH